MQIKLFVGSLPWSIGDQELEALFEPHGTVHSARVITDRETGRSRGFGFVEMEVEDSAAIISQMDGQEVEGRAIRVNEAEDRRDRGGGGGRGGRDMGGGGPRRNQRSGGGGGGNMRRNRY